MAMELTSPFAQWFISSIYILGQLLLTNYSKRKVSVYDAIYEAKPELEKNKKKAKRLYREIQYCKFMYGIATKEYFVYEFDKLSHEGRKQFVTRSNKYNFYRKFNNENYIDYLNKKTETYRLFKDFYNRDVVCLYDEGDFEVFKKFVDKHSKFIYKPAEDYGGHGIKIYNKDNFDSLEDLFTLIIFGGGCVLEELIVQGEEIAEFHRDSVNTVRLVTYRDHNGEPNIQWCFLRMGSGGSHTDNMSSGGIAAMIDYDTGIIYKEGRDWEGKKYMYHPDSKKQLIGFQMPKWDEVRTVIKDLVNVIPEVRFVGWDLAYTTKGWTFVEGNAKPQCVSAQISEYNGKLYKYQQADELYKLERK